MNPNIPIPERPFPSRVREALSQGMLWRAKEMLQGTIATSKYDPLLYEQYGIILLQMNDMVEAGKYLFLSGQVKEEYREALTLYLEKFGRSDWQTLVGSFPRKAKNIQLELFPADVRQKLKELRIPANRGEETPAQVIASQQYRENKFSDTVALITCGCIGFLIAICFIAGIASIIQIVTSWFR